MSTKAVELAAAAARIAWAAERAGTQVTRAVERAELAGWGPRTTRAVERARAEWESLDAEAKLATERAAELDYETRAS